MSEINVCKCENCGELAENWCGGGRRGWVRITGSRIQISKGNQYELVEFSFKENGTIDFCCFECMMRFMYGKELEKGGENSVSSYNIFDWEYHPERYQSPVVGEAPAVTC